MDLVSEKAQACAAVDAAGRELVALSHAIHDHPELAFAEHRAAGLLADVLERSGLRTTRAAYGLPTAFVASAGPLAAPNVVICCEYDALPGMGHACGHNVIAAAGVGAGIALAGIADRLGGRVTVLGTPAEESGGGKVILLERRAFDGAVAAMLVHPSNENNVLPHICSAVHLDVAFRGKAAHAGMFPERGVNALDAIVVGHLGLATLRQHLVPTDRVHGIITLGGEAPNVVPARAEGRYIVRSARSAHLAELARKVAACFEAGAAATGATLGLSWGWPVYQELVPSRPLATAFASNVTALGRRPTDGPPLPPHVAGSTDLGNVSSLVPTIHPKLRIGPSHVVQHTPAFERLAALPQADRAVLDGAKAMAMTVIDVWCRPRLRTSLQRSHPGPIRPVHYRR